ncbi:DUF1552 domain-containing protein [Stratiformator vulcanicus]|uniref:DUF1552 domain-containing protein n=1 Tax=Stratiformator vulcanicus TaxID=2527980 RepID=A0A517R076_9PLAN|nr:DUF1552 domain-containing protein [Stratiformator vulcanicus]QDT37220.1 hypothetical protein Pan189_15930 [Stratiformator vulcanicus]
MRSIKRFRLDRRTFLRGTGVAVGLPYLEAMMPSTALSSPNPEITPRMAMFYFGTGMNMRQFYPEGTGYDAKMSRILKPLEKQRGDFTVFSNTWLEHGGGHDGAYPFATGIPRGEKQILSPDQIVAQVHGQYTRFPSLQMSVKKGTGFGSQALATLSWNEQGVPLAAENDPKSLFDKLFRPDSEEDKANRSNEFRQRGSVLDMIMDDSKRLEGKLGKADQEQLDQYLNSIREMEKTLARDIDWADRPKPQPKLSDYGDYSKSMDGDKADVEGNGKFLYDTYGKLMYDLIALAFQTDSTRAITYVVRTELAGGVYPEFGVSKGYHSLTHHGNDPQNLEELAKVDTIYMQHWSHFLDRLRGIKDGDGTLLDHTMLGFSSGMGIGHSKEILPTVLSGGSGLGIQHQTHLELKDKTPLSSLWRTMVDRMGVPVEGDFQDSNGVIKEVLS